MAMPHRTDVAARVLLVWFGVCGLSTFATGLSFIFYVVFSLPFEMVAVIIAIFAGDSIVAHPVRWVAAAIVLPLALTLSSLVG